MRKPNVLWFQADEQRPDSLSCYGSSWARTPNIDRIASRGTVLQSAVCASPVCLPSRSAQLSGRYPHEFGCLNNMLLDGGRRFPAGYTTFPEVLATLGYETVNFGRFHCLSETTFQTNLTTPDCLPEYTGYCDLAPAYDEEEHNVLKRPGIDHRPLIVAGSYPGRRNPCAISSDRAIEFLHARRAGDRPFLLRVGYNWPHTPTLAVPPFDTLYDPRNLPVRYFDAKARDGRSRFDRCYAYLHRMWEFSDEQYDRIWKDYMGCCAYVDFEVGRVPAALDATGLAGDTIIFYSVDHGKSLGEWGAGEKCTFDREVWRVPFIWSFPGTIAEGRVVDRPCETIDTARTRFAILGLDDRLPEQFRGRNVLASDGDGDDDGVAFGVTRPPIDDDPAYDPRLMRVAVRTPSTRMDVSWRTDGARPLVEKLDGNLFDLGADPYETRNLFNDTTHEQTVERHLQLIERWMARCPPHSLLADPDNAGRLF